MLLNKLDKGCSLCSCRDIIFCSTLASVGLIVRTSYWLVGSQLELTGRLARALDQVILNLTCAFCEILRPALLKPFERLLL
jgi:hypothetical protein